MKKTISINIGGIIFHIEEDGYDLLKSYLNDIENYFTNYEESKEIIADIESRIAEIFLSKISNAQQAIVLDDVRDLKNKMGDISDFQAIEDDGDLEDRHEQNKYRSNNASNEATKLYRDTKRKILGGVASGLAHYLKTDPLWIRLIFLACFFNVFFGIMSAAILIAYIVMWIVVPQSNELSEDGKARKMFRNPENKVLGGVAGGIASYFGLDASVVRFIFVLSFFLGGTGFILYILFWLIIPEAKTLTEKMQMEGEPITLENIKESMNINQDEGSEENNVTKILLFPFRVLAAFLTYMGKLLGVASSNTPDILRLIIGTILSMAGFLMVLVFVLLITIGFGGFVIFDFNYLPFPLTAFSSLGYLGLAALFVVGFFPMCFFIFSGISLLTNRILFNYKLLILLCLVWIMGIVTLIYSSSVMLRQFNTDETVARKEAHYMAADTLYMDVESVGSNYDISISLRNSKDSSVQIKQYLSAYGSSKSESLANAGLINYKYEIKGDTIIFDDGFQLKKDSPDRRQSLKIVLYLPKKKLIQMTQTFKDKLVNTSFSEFMEDQVPDLEKVYWNYKDGEWNCNLCIERSKDNKAKNGYQTLKPFEEILIDGVIEVIIEQDSVHSFYYSDETINSLKIKQRDERLYISSRNDFWNVLKKQQQQKQVAQIYITTPSLSEIALKGFSSVDIKEFVSQELSIKLNDASSASIDLESDHLQIRLYDMSKLTLNGKANESDIKIHDMSRLEADSCEIRSVHISSYDISSASINVSERLTGNSHDVSHVSLIGKAKLIEVESYDISRIGD